MWPIKREVQESEASSAEFVCDDTDLAEIRDESVVKIEADPRQICARLAAVRIEPPAPSASSSSEDIAGASGTAYRKQALRRIPSAQLGPADPPRGRGRPKGSKSRPRVPLTFGTSPPPERAAAAKARAEMAPRK